MTPLVYIASPYTHPDPVENTHHVLKLATELYECCDCIPVVPHLTLLWNLVTPRPVDFWYGYDLAVMCRCDAVYRTGGTSVGADREVEIAGRNGIPVFTDRAALVEWIRKGDA